MERARTLSRFVRNAALVVLALLLAIYLPLRVRMAREERARGTPAPGTSISIFVTNRLGGYREPCG
jgi:hypothetical protein